LKILNLHVIAALTIAVSIGLLGGCGEENAYVEPPPPPVTVAKPLQQTVIDYLEFTGTTAAVEQVEVRARVKGFLQSMHFESGTQVEKGDLLFVIDPKPFQAKLDAAKAELASAEARLTKAESDFLRLSEAGSRGAVTERDVVAAEADRDAAKAAVSAAEAAVTDAELEFGYTRVTAPISGRISRNQVDVGNLVGDGDATLLTIVTKYDPIYAYFNINERDLLRVMQLYRENVKAKGIDPDTQPDTDIPLYLELANEEGFPHEGELNFAESDVNPDTGTLQLRGVFPNPADPPVILPGLFTRIRLPLEQQQDALLVSERALGFDQGGPYLLAINDQNIVEKKPIVLDQLMDGLRVVKAGLEPGDWVVINGVQRARPGAKVDPQRTEMPTMAASAVSQSESSAATQTVDTAPSAAQESDVDSE
jgi:RND family efflux transporter MFP subunit